MSGLKPPKTQINRKKITITTSFLESKRVPEGKQYPKWKVLLCKFIGVIPQEKNQYLFRAQFKNGKLKSGDVIVNPKGVTFAVAQVQRNRLRFVSLGVYADEPLSEGIFQILENPKEAK